MRKRVVGRQSLGGINALWKMEDCWPSGIVLWGMVPRSGFGGARGSAPGGRNREELSTVAAVAGGPSRSSDEAPVMGVEPRGRLIRDGSLGQLVERPGGAR